MKTVSKNEFHQYFQDKQFTREQGECFHSEYYLVDGEKLGYLETSSYGAPAIYQLKYGTVNFETINFIGNIIKNRG